MNRRALLLFQASTPQMDNSFSDPRGKGGDFQNDQVFDQSRFSPAVGADSFQNHTNKTFSILGRLSGRNVAR